MTHFTRVVSYALSGSNKTQLKRGKSKYTEHYAYPYILPLLGPENQGKESLALRLAAMIADTGIPNENSYSLGKFLAINAKNAGLSENVELRLTQLMHQDAEAAAISVTRILQMLQPTRGGFNWYKFADLLYYWGNGISDASLQVRQTILRDYYISDYKPEEGDTV